MNDIVEEATAVLAHPRRFKVSPAELYLATLNTRQSRKTARETLERLTRLLKKPGWEIFPWESLTATETTYLHAALAQSYSPATLRLSMSVLRGVLRQAFRLKLIDAETYQRAIILPKIKSEKSLAGRSLSEVEIKTLAAYIAALDRPRGAMVAAIFAAGLGGGLRREELATVRVDALSADGACLKVDGKGRRKRDQPLPAWAGRVLKAWLAVRSALGLTCATMFVQGTGGPYLADAPMTVNDVWRLITEVGERSGVAHFTPHDLRRTFATRALLLTDTLSVQKLMGHSDPATTALYDRRDAAVAAKAVEGLEGWGFGDTIVRPTEGPPVKTPLTASLAALAAARAKKKNGATVATSPGGQRGKATEAPTTSLAVQVEEASAKVEHPVTGQRLVNRRTVQRPDYLRHGRPLDLAWVRGQVKTLQGMKIPAERIASALVKTGVRRGDGSDVEAGDVQRWAVP
jgi:integrase